VSKKPLLAWCWCYCCKRRLEVHASAIRSKAEATFMCCGRTWKLDEPQPRALHEGQAAEVENLRELVSLGASALARWQGRRPKGLKALCARLEAAERAGRARS
jgi:hypothetical protein